MKNVARILPAVLASALVSCDRQERSFSPTGPGYGSVVPRLVSGSGKIDSAKYVSVLVWYRATDTTPEHLRRIDSIDWKLRRIQVDQIPLGSTWRMQVAGWNAAGDSVWKATGSGALAKDNGKADLSGGGSDSGTVLEVRNFAPAPEIRVVGTDSARSDTLTVGDTVEVTGGHVAIGLWQGAACDSLNGPVQARLAIADTFVYSGLRLEAASCADGKWTTRTIFVRAVRPRPVAPGLYDTISVGGGFAGDSLASPKAWDRPAELGIASKSGLDSVALVWNAVAETDTIPPDSARWSRIPVPGPAVHQGDGNGSLDLSTVARSLDSNAVQGRLLLVAVALRRGVAVDTARLSWKISFPNPDTLEFGLSRGDGSLSWSRRPQGAVRPVHVGRADGGTSSPALLRDASLEEVTVSGLGPREAVQVALLVQDSATRRVRTQILSATSRNAPATPSLLAANTDTLVGKVHLALSGTDTAGTTFTYGVAADSLSPSQIASPFLRSGDSLVVDLYRNPGNWRVYVKATRDSLERVIDTIVRVRNSEGSILQDAQDLHLSERTLATLEWTWKGWAGQTQKWRVCWAPGPAALDTSMANCSTKDDTGFRLVGQAQGTTIRLGVFALPLDSNHRASSGAYSSATTRKAPADFGVAWDSVAHALTWAGQAGLRYVWTLSRNGAPIDSGTIVSAPWSWSPSLSAALLSGPVHALSVKVCNGDSVCSNPGTVGSIAGNFHLQPPTNPNVRIQGDSLSISWNGSDGASGYLVRLRTSPNGATWTLVDSVATSGSTQVRWSLPTGAKGTTFRFLASLVATNALEKTFETGSSRAQAILPGPLPKDTIWSTSPTRAVVQLGSAAPSGWTVWGRTFTGTSWEAARPFSADTLVGAIFGGRLFLERWMKSSSGDSTSPVRDTATFSSVTDLVDHCSDGVTILGMRCILSAGAKERLSYRFSEGGGWSDVPLDSASNLRKTELVFSGRSTLQLRVSDTVPTHLPLVLEPKTVRVASDLKDTGLTSTWISGNVVVPRGLTLSITPSTGRMVLTNSSAGALEVQFSLVGRTGLQPMDLTGMRSVSVVFPSSVTVVPDLHVHYGRFFDKLNRTTTYSSASVPFSTSDNLTWSASLAQAVNSSGTNVSSALTNAERIGLTVPAGATWILTGLQLNPLLSYICVPCLNPGLVLSP